MRFRGWVCFAALLVPWLAGAAPPPQSAIAREFFGRAAAGLSRYWAGCAASPSCRLSDAERSTLAALRAYVAAHAGALSLRFATPAGPGDTPGDGAVSRWAGDVLVVDETRLHSRDDRGRAEVFSVFRAVAELTARLGEVAPATDAAVAARVGDRVASWLHEHAEVARLGQVRAFTAIDLGDPNAFTEIWVQDDTRVLDVGARMRAALRCADGSAPLGFRVWSLNWAHGIPGDIFQQPLRGRLNLTCATGVEAGNDVFAVMKFADEHLVSDEVDVQPLACSLGGCFPKRCGSD
jgi:hypothetical protein